MPAVLAQRPFRGHHSAVLAGGGLSAQLLISVPEYGYSGPRTEPSPGARGVDTIACVSVVPLVFTSGWASGINAYAVVLLLGLFGATGVSDEAPAALQRTDVLIVAGVLFLCEAVADKIPYVDSVWDTAHTVIRPLAGAVIAALLAGESGSLPELAAGAIGGSTALMSHLVKAGTRMAVNTSPEPFSNVGMSIAEDLGVAGGRHVRPVQPGGGRRDRGRAAGARDRHGALPRLADPPLPAPPGPAPRGETAGRDGWALA